ncbi:MAG: DUF5916 domain-containing protein [Balneolaceae bacterium]
MKSTLKSLCVNISYFITTVSALYFSLLILLFSPGLLYAQETPSVAAYKINSSIQIDGRLDEEAWEEAERVTDFLQFEPDEGASPSQPTDVRILYGEGNLYIGATLYDENPAAIERTLGRRDEYNRADWFIVSIDSYFDRQNAFSFGVNAAGIQYDGLRSGSGGNFGPGIPGIDTSWDAVWYSEIQVTDEGWVVEIQIPYSMLRFPESELQTWGIHFMRRIPRLGEESEWPMVPRTHRDNLIARFGLLTDISDIEPRPNIQVRPYTVSRLNTSESNTDPGELATDATLDVGGDVKIGLGPNITLDATINPDFGQIESDPAVLNLTAFETFFEEQRPFFIEGIQIYEFSVGPGELLYTRRIGAQNPIIGAAKVSGRTERGLSFGVLGATTGDNFNPSRNYGVTRMSQQIGDYSSAGGIMTLYDSPYDIGEGRRQSFTGGADWDLRFADNGYGIEGFASYTHRTLTSDESSETGFAGKMWTRKRQGIWTGFAGVDIFSDQYNPNDLGQLRRNNMIVTLSRIEHQINGSRPFGPFQRADASVFGVQQFSYDGGLNLGLELDFRTNWTFRTFQSMEASLGLENMFGGYDLFETRGLGPWASPSSVRFGVEYETDSRKSWEVEPEVAGTFYGDGGRGYEIGLRGNWDIGSRLSLSGNLEGEWEKGVTAWTANETFRNTGSGWLIGRHSASPEDLNPQDYEPFDDEGRLAPVLAETEPYDDNLYFVPVFGERDTRSLDLTLRSTVTFTRNLSLQVYSQMFLARGRFDNFQIMQNRDDLAEFDSYPKRDEFSLNSLQSNVVLRWEYRPGSTVFLVWSHGRSGRDQLNPLAQAVSSPYDRLIGTQIGDTFDIFPENTFLIKVNYTFLY